MWNIMLFASLGISIYEILFRFLHSTYRYMKHCVDAFIQHIDIWNSVLMPSFNISIYEILNWCLHSTYRYMKHSVDAFIQHIDIWNIVLIPSFNISIYENLCWTHQVTQPCVIPALKPFKSFAMYETCWILQPINRYIQHVMNFLGSLPSNHATSTQFLVMSSSRFLKHPPLYGTWTDK
jgi:hypothetical protein